MDNSQIKKSRCKTHSDYKLCDLKELSNQVQQKRRLHNRNSPEGLNVLSDDTTIDVASNGIDSKEHESRSDIVDNFDEVDGEPMKSGNPVRRSPRKTLMETDDSNHESIPESKNFGNVGNSIIRKRQRGRPSKTENSSVKSKQRKLLKETDGLDVRVNPSQHLHDTCSSGVEKRTRTCLKETEGLDKRKSPRKILRETDGLDIRKSPRKGNVLSDGSKFFSNSTKLFDKGDVVQTSVETKLEDKRSFTKSKEQYKKSVTKVRKRTTKSPKGSSGTCSDSSLPGTSMSVTESDCKESFTLDDGSDANQTFTRLDNSSSSHPGRVGKRCQKPKLNSAKKSRIDKTRVVDRDSIEDINVPYTMPCTSPSMDREDSRDSSLLDHSAKMSRIDKSRALDTSCSIRDSIEDMNVPYSMPCTSPSKDREDSRDSSLLDLTIPSPTGVSAQTDCDTFRSLSNSSVTQEDSSSDSDSDLPEGWTPIKCDDKTYAVGDIVWAKFRTNYYLPAIVRHIYKKKRRVTVIYFEHANQPESQYTMVYKCLLPFLSSKKDEIMEEGERLEGDDGVQFRQGVDRLEEFLAKKASKLLKEDDPWSFFNPRSTEYPPVRLSSQPSLPETETVDNQAEKIEESAHTQLIPGSTETKLTEYKPRKKPVLELSKKGQQRKERMNEKTQQLTEFLISDSTKEYLKKIFKEQVTSDLHMKFKTGTIKERMRMKHRGFGPIDDDSQIESILDTYVKWLSEWNTSPYLNKVDYIFDVWVPEAVVRALIKLKGYGRKRAWEMFNKGVRTTKEELQLIFDALIS